MKFHTVANIFPMMSPSELKELKEDIAKNGLLEPIWTYKKQIIDGRNRFLACKEVGVDPVYIEWRSVNGTSLIDFVISLNLKRRHLNASQKAMSAVDALPFFEEQAHERKISTLKIGNNESDRALMPEQEKGRSRDIVSKLFGVSPRYVQYGKSIHEKLPELADQICEGNLTINQAKLGIGDNWTGHPQSYQTASSPSKKKQLPVDHYPSVSKPCQSVRSFILTRMSQ